MGLFIFLSEDGHGFYFFIFQKQIEEGKSSVRSFFIKHFIFCLFIFICKFFVTFFTLEREGGRGFSFSFSKLLKGKGGMDICTFLVFFFLTFKVERGTWVYLFINSLSFQRMGRRTGWGNRRGA